MEADLFCLFSSPSQSTVPEVPGQHNQSRELGALQLPVCLEPISYCQRQKFISPQSHCLTAAVWTILFARSCWQHVTSHFPGATKAGEWDISVRHHVPERGISLWLRPLRCLLSTLGKVLKTFTSVSGTVSIATGRFCSIQDLCVLHMEISPFPNPSYRGNILDWYCLCCCSK